jgi:hypothetical protein
MSLLENSDYIADLESGKFNTAIADYWEISEASVRRHRDKLSIPRQDGGVDTEGGNDKVGGESFWTNPDGTIDYRKFSEKVWTRADHENFMRASGIDPDKFTFSTGWTSRPGGGFWNKINNVRPIVENVEETVDWPAASKFIEGFTYIPAKREFLVDSAMLQPTDEQWGKTDYAGGTPETEERVLQSYSSFVDYIKEYRPRQVLLARTGDGIENTCSTGSQRDTNDLDVPHQLVQSYKMDLQGVSMIAPHVQEMFDARVTSNHGRWRTGMKADAGNPHADFGIGVGRQLEQTQKTLDVLPNVKFLFPNALMESMTVKLDAVSFGMVHGHQAGGPDKMGDWWGKQDHGRMPTWEADYLLVGHWHSYRKYQSGDGRWVIIGPASDPGSSWFSNLKGERAASGMLAMCFEGKKHRFEEIL